MRLATMAAACALLAGCAILGPTQGTRAQYVAAHPGMAADVSDAVLRGEIMQGMTYDDVVASWGAPCVTCYGNSNTPYGHVRVWNPISYQYVSSNSYVYFDGNWRVTSWHTP